MQRRFQQVDVFAESGLRGNPVAVVVDGEGLTGEQMQRFARWTNLSETTFLLPPQTDQADYRVRIFTPGMELPFAGHPTLGSCHAWLDIFGSQKTQIVQECESGLVPVRRDGLLWFAAPPLVRSGQVDAADLRRIAAALRIEVDDIVAANWVDNGPGWVAVLLADAAAVLDVRPGPLDGLAIGVVGPGGDADLEVRAFFDEGGVTIEDPVTGSLNASVAEWLVGSDRLRFPYTASQGRVIGRDGRVHLDRDELGTIWAGGNTTTVIRGTVDL